MPRRKASDALARAFKHCKAVLFVSCRHCALTADGRAKRERRSQGGWPWPWISPKRLILSHMLRSTALQAASVPVEIRHVVFLLDYRCLVSCTRRQRDNSRRRLSGCATGMRVVSAALCSGGGQASLPTPEDFWSRGGSFTGLLCG